MSMMKIIEAGESETTEFKTSLAEWRDVVETISAFSNRGGGLIFVGVGDDYEIIGIDDGKSTLENLANQIKQNTDPVIYPSIRIEEIGGKPIIVVDVKEFEQKPVLAFGRGFMRVGKSSQKIGYEEIRRLALLSSKVYWDGRVCEGAGLEDIDEGKVRWFLDLAKRERGLDIREDATVDEVLMRLRLSDDDRLTNAAVLLFGKEPERFFTRPDMKCVRFKGTGVTGEMIDFKVVKGNLFDQMVETERFIYNNISLATWIENGELQRQERWEYPQKAIREALANAFCHRGYETTSSAQVRIFDDRMEIWNPGRLPDGWTVETLKQKHESKPPNPHITEHFFWVKYVEDVGTGTNKIIDWCKEWGFPEPIFEFTETSVIVTLRKTVSSSNIDRLGLNERQKIVVDYVVKHDSITNTKYMELTGVSRRTATSDLAYLVDEGIFVRMGEGKRDFRYVLLH